MDKKKKLALGAAGALLVFGLGAATASGGKGSAQAAAPEPKPAPTVTVTAPAPEPVVKTVEKTPQSCLDALDRAGAAIGFMSDIGPLSGKAVQAAFIRDAAGLEAITSQVQALNDRLKKATPGIASASQECRAGAK